MRMRRLGLFLAICCRVEIGIWVCCSNCSHSRSSSGCSRVRWRMSLNLATARPTIASVVKVLLGRGVIVFLINYYMYILDSMVLFIIIIKVDQ